MHFVTAKICLGETHFISVTNKIVKFTIVFGCSNQISLLNWKQPQNNGVQHAEYTDRNAQIGPTKWI